MSMSTYRMNEIVIRTGTIGGMVAGGLGAVQFGLAPLAAGSTDTGALHNLGNASMLASFATFFVVGFLVRQRTGSVNAAARAGFVAAVIACLLSGLAVVMLGAFVPSAYAPETAQAVLGIDGSSAGASVFVALTMLIIQAAAGFGIALAGALARRPRSTSDDRRRPATTGGRVHSYR